MKTLEFIIKSKRIEGIAKMTLAAKKATFENAIQGGLLTVNERGIKATEARILSKIQDKIEDAEGNTIDLEDAEFKLVKDAIENGTFHPGHARTVAEYLDFIEDAELADRKKKK